MIINRTLKNISVIMFGILFTLFLSCTFVFAQNSVDVGRFTDREEDGLLGPVKSVALFFDGKSTPIWTRSYRNDGSIEMIEYTMFANHIITTHDNRGRIIKNEIVKQGKKELSSYSIYDDVNHTCTTYFQDPDILPKEQSEKLTVDGDVLETSHYSPTGEYIGNTLYEYNEKGLLVSMTKCSAKGIPFETYKTLYDFKGRLVEKNRYDSSYRIYKGPRETILAYKECYSYNTKGHLIEKRIYRGSPLELITISTYTGFDKYGNATKQTDKNLEEFLKGLFPPIKHIKYEYFK